jgi:transcriptional regulator with XRE-family HTH domain
MPQRVAASRAGLDDSYWARLERGRCDPTLTSLLRIQRALGLDSIETLLGPTASSGLAQTLSDGVRDERPDGMRSSP